MSAATALIGARIFTGEVWLDGQAVLIEHGRIAAIMPEAELPAKLDLAVLRGMLVPGFVDVQVNGGGGVLFNATPEPDALRRMAAAHARHGTTCMLPTYITDRAEGMAQAMAAVQQVLGEGSIAGLHLEGPFLALSRKGAHDPALIRPLRDEDVGLLLACPVRPLLLTVAADNARPDQIARLVAGGITVSLGHSEASHDQVLAAVQAGARGITHLYNAMSPLQHREPGVVGAALESGALWCGIIPDGHHVHPAALRIALRAKRGPGRLFAVSDAMPTAGDSNDVFFLNGRKVTRRDGVLRLDDGTLAGSDLTMDQALRYCHAQLDVSLEEALRMVSLYPAQFLGLAGKGRIVEGADADFVLLDESLRVKACWIGGNRVARQHQAGQSRADVDIRPPHN